VSDFILIDGDLAKFEPAFGPALVVVQPGRISASGSFQALRKKACVAGDEASVSARGCIYTAGRYSIPGTGTLTIKSLAEDQMAKTCGSGGKKLLLKGSAFTAQLTVDVPAMQPPPGPASPIPDPNKSYAGSGSFVTVNASVKAS
jgi:hypothetical protein